MKVVAKYKGFSLSLYVLCLFNVISYLQAYEQSSVAKG